MALNNYDDPFERDDFQDEFNTPEPEKKPGNRNFMTIIIVLGIIFLVALLGLLLFAPRYIASQRAAQMEEAAAINAANTATAIAGIEAENLLHAQQTQTVIAAMPTAAPTNTPVVAVATHTPVVASTELSAEELATVSALQTQMAGGGTTLPTATVYAFTSATPTALPETGFMDDIGLPTMAGIAVLLIMIIVFSRHLRLSAR